MKHFDCVVVGAGVAGLGIAVALAKKKKKVLVVSRKGLAGEASARAAGILDPYLELPKGSPMLPLTLEAFRTFPAWVRELERTSGIPIEYRKTGMLYAARNRHEEKKLRDRFLWQQNYSVAVRWMNKPDLLKNYPSLSESLRSGLFYPDVAKVRAEKLIQAMALFAKAKGVCLLSSRKAPRIFPAPHQKFDIGAEGKRYAAEYVVNAAGSWCADQGLLSGWLPVVPVRGQIFILRGQARFPAILHSVRGHYLVPWERKKYLAGSTLEFAGYRAYVTQKAEKEILHALAGLFPPVKEMKVIRSWAGLRPYSPDGLPVVGAMKTPGFYTASGYFRSGILLGVYVGKLLADAVLSGRIPSVLKPFAPERFKGFFDENSCR